MISVNASVEPFRTVEAQVDLRPAVSASCHGRSFVAPNTCSIGKERVLDLCIHKTFPQFALLNFFLYSAILVGAYRMPKIARCRCMLCIFSQVYIGAVLDLAIDCRHRRCMLFNCFQSYGALATKKCLASFNHCGQRTLP